MAKEKVDPCDVVRDFFSLCMLISDDFPIYVGIDPGTNGAIGFVCQRVHAAIDIPNMVLEVKKTKRADNIKAGITRIKDPIKRAEKQALFDAGKIAKSGKGTVTKFDYPKIGEIFRYIRGHKSRVIVVLEAIPPSLGPGRRAAEIALNRAYAMWPLFLDYNGYRVEDVAPSIWKPKMGLNKDKNKSLLKARGMFPNAELSLAKHHDRAEALLLCEYMRRVHAGKDS
jgi:hypothetical protein